MKASLMVVKLFCAEIVRLRKADTTETNYLHGLTRNPEPLAGEESQIIRCQELTYLKIAVGKGDIIVSRGTAVVANLVVVLVFLTVMKI